MDRPDLQDLTPEAIETMVSRFYAAVQQDDLIGPVFAARIDDWEPHLARMTAFWRSVLRGEHLFVPGPRGGPPALHRQIDELSRDHFDRWLKLFRETTTELFPAPTAHLVHQRAQQIGHALASHLPEPRS